VKCLAVGNLKGCEGKVREEGGNVEALYTPLPSFEEGSIVEGGDELVLPKTRHLTRAKKMMWDFMQDDCESSTSAGFGLHITLTRTGFRASNKRWAK